MKKILVIEDEYINQDLYQVILSKAFSDIKILRALTGESGMLLASQEDPDVILLDLRLPDIDGFTVAAKLKANVQSSRIPILIVSALGNEPDIRAKAFSSGADGFVNKPFGKAELINNISLMLRIRNSEKLIEQQDRKLNYYIQSQTGILQDTPPDLISPETQDQYFFWETDGSGKVNVVSPGITQVLGYNPEELTQGNLELMFLPKEDQNVHFREFEWLGTKKEGGEVWLSITGFPILEEKSDGLRFRGLAQDITSQKTIQLQLEKSLLEIREYQDKIKGMNNALTRAEERERRKISEYLHDVLGATLAIANMKLTALQLDKIDSAQRIIILEASEMLQAAIKESRAVIYELSPPMLYELGMLPTLQWKLEEIEKQGRLTAKLECQTDFGVMDPEYLIFVYRLLSELLLNTVKHAQADKVRVKIKTLYDFLSLEVTDNGIGMDPGILYDLNRRSGFGLFSMRERIESIGGSFRIESEPMKYTTSYILLPISK